MQCVMIRRDFYDHARVVWVARYANHAGLWATLQATGFPRVRYAKLVAGRVRIRGGVSDARYEQHELRLGAEAAARTVEPITWSAHQRRLKEKKRKGRRGRKRSPWRKTEMTLAADRERRHEATRKRQDARAAGRKEGG